MDGVKKSLILATLAFCHGAGADSYYQWTDANGAYRVSRDTPPMGVPYETVSVPDVIRWSDPPEMPAERPPQGKLSTQDLFRLAAPSVYWLVAGPWPAAGKSAGTTYGSAVAISEDMAITNCHVLGRAGQEATIGSGDQEEVARAEVVAMNLELDRCVLLVRDLRLRPVPGVRHLDTLEVGEPVYAIGNPRQLERTLSDGLLSGMRVLTNQRVLQTTAAISPGSSGGGLFDSRGNLIGITSSSLRGAQNINFAIPAEDFWR